MGKWEEVAEERIEFYCAEEMLEKVAAAIRAVHPYEVVPIDTGEILIL